MVGTAAEEKTRGRDEDVEVLFGIRNDNINFGDKARSQTDG